MEKVIRLDHTDAAGVVYFANLFTFANQCFESFLEQWKTLRQIIEENEFITPVVHAQADFLKPIKLSEKITIEMSLQKTGTTSFELEYKFTDSNANKAAIVKTTHTTINPKTRKPMEIPAKLKALLESLPTTTTETEA